MGFFFEIKEVIRYFKFTKENPDFTFYSESGIYYQNFRGILDEILRRSQKKIAYLTSDLNDPVWSLKNDRLVPFYLKSLVHWFFPFVSTKKFVMTMADLHRFHIKRSSTPGVEHIYVFHAINSIHMTYNLGAFDHYDTVFCVGPHHTREIRLAEELYKTKPKKLVEVGYHLLEDMAKKYDQKLTRPENKPPKILIAPSWNQGNIMESCLDELLQHLLSVPYQVVLRPHPEFIRRYPQKIDEIKKTHGGKENFVFELNSASDESIQSADLLITDWSGISLEFAWAMGRPVIFIETPQKVHNPDYEKLGSIPLELQLRKEIGSELELNELQKITGLISEKLADPFCERERLFNLRAKHLYNWNHSSEVAAEYLLK